MMDIILGSFAVVAVFALVGCASVWVVIIVKILTMWASMLFSREHSDFTALDDNGNERGCGQ